MGQRGPAAKPHELKVLEGNRGHRPLNLNETFRPEVGEPNRPRWLGREATKVWKRLAPELLRYNLLSKIDQEGFAMLCQTAGRLEQIERSIAGRQAQLISEKKEPADALMDRTPNGLLVQSALYQVLNKEQAKLHRLLESFGLRPDARARVTTALRAQMSLELVPGDIQAPAQRPADEPRGFADFS